MKKNGEIYLIKSGQYCLPKLIESLKQTSHTHHHTYHHTYHQSYRTQAPKLQIQIIYYFLFYGAWPYQNCIFEHYLNLTCFFNRNKNISYKKNSRVFRHSG
jgi:hypothetical protein